MSVWQVGVGADLHNLSTGDDDISVFCGTQIKGSGGALGLGHAPCSLCTFLLRFETALPWIQVVEEPRFLSGVKAGSSSSSYAHGYA